MTQLSDLIARLEAAKEGSRELDVEIARAIGLIVITAVLPATPDNWQVKNPKQPGVATWDLRRYTTSLDAALTLVPDGWMYQLLKTSGVLMVSGKPYSASIKAPSEHGWVDPPRPFNGDADSMPLALCIAALKAREAPR